MKFQSIWDKEEKHSHKDKVAHLQRNRIRRSVSHPLQLSLEDQREILLKTEKKISNLELSTTPKPQGSVDVQQNYCEVCKDSSD